jgi:hypothetical protein
VALSALACASVPALADVKNKAEGRASVEIVKPVEISYRDTLNFGRVILMKDSGGTITVAPDGTCTLDGGGGLVRDGAVSAGKFALDGAPGTNFTLQLSSSRVPLKLSGSAAPAMPLTVKITSLVVDAKTVRVPDAAGPFSTSKAGSFKLPTGPAFLHVGGELVIPGKASTGVYQGEFDVTVVHE